MFLSGLYVYPIKSLKGLSLQEAKVERRGLQYDRRWMLIDADTRFMTQREYPTMATITVAIDAAGLRVAVKNQSSLIVPFETNGSKSLQVQIWKDSCQALPVDGNIDGWFSEVLGTACRLVYMPDQTRRAVNPSYAIGDDVVSFADAYPFLLMTEASLEDLNSRLPIRISMNRFRPNLVISGAEAFAEDNWKSVQIGAAGFHVVKPCARCVLPSVDQESGVKTGDEPLRTLSTFRRRDNEVHFGQNLIANGEDKIMRVGDRLTVTAT